MKLDRLSGGGWLLRLGGHQIVLSGDELDELAQSLAFRLESHGFTDRSGLSLSVSADDKANIHIAYADEIPDLIEELKEFVPDYMKETK